MYARQDENVLNNQKAIMTSPFVPLVAGPLVTEVEPTEANRLEAAI